MFPDFVFLSGTEQVFHDSNEIFINILNTVIVKCRVTVFSFKVALICASRGRSQVLKPGGNTWNDPWSWDIFHLIKTKLKSRHYVKNKHTPTVCVGVQAEAAPEPSAVCCSDISHDPMVLYHINLRRL